MTMLSVLLTPVKRRLSLMPKKSPNELIGEALEAARTRAGLTQTEVAKRIGLSRVQVNQHEHGRGMKEATLERYADFYRIKAGDLRYGAPAGPASVAEAVAALDVAWRRLLDSLEREKVLPRPSERPMDPPG
jgi:transcriptional regulator with XRE-family HTH domain